MFRFLQKHMKSNRGDANVSKMTIIAIAFVVGAILLVLTTSAFRNPINRWFSNVTHGWFAEENGQFDLMLNPFANYERNSNGTIKNVVYRHYNDDGSYEELCFDVSKIEVGTQDAYVFTCYTADGAVIDNTDTWPWSGAAYVTVSDDGMTITYQGQSTYTAYEP